MLLAGAAGAMACAAVAFTPNGACQGLAPIVLVDSTGKVAAKPLTDTVVLVTDPAGAASSPLHPSVRSRVTTVAPRRASRPGNTAAASCTRRPTARRAPMSHEQQRRTSRRDTGRDAGRDRALRRRHRDAGDGDGAFDPLRQWMQVGDTPQNGLVPVDVTVNLTATYPPPLSFR